MLLRTYEKILESFDQAHGYQSFADLKEQKITILQIRELEEQGVLRKFARGWYWCEKGKWELPLNHRYIEIAKVDPEAVICMESACFLNGIIKKEPEVISVATKRTDRRKLEFDFPVHRYYLQDSYLPGEICTVETEFGSYRYYCQERTFCDCIRMSTEIQPELMTEIMDEYKKQRGQMQQIKAYGSALRALRNIERADLMIK